jgi:hypothetical protein
LGPIFGGNFEVFSLVQFHNGDSSSVKLQCKISSLIGNQCQSFVFFFFFFYAYMFCWTKYLMETIVYELI